MSTQKGVPATFKIFGEHAAIRISIQDPHTLLEMTFGKMGIVISFDSEKYFVTYDKISRIEKRKPFTDTIAEFRIFCEVESATVDVVHANTFPLFDLTRCAVEHWLIFGDVGIKKLAARFNLVDEKNK